MDNEQFARQARIEAQISGRLNVILLLSCLLSDAWTISSTAKRQQNKNEKLSQNYRLHGKRDPFGWRCHHCIVHWIASNDTVDRNLNHARKKGKRKKKCEMRTAGENVGVKISCCEQKSQAKRTMNAKMVETWSVEWNQINSFIQY